MKSVAKLGILASVVSGDTTWIGSKILEQFKPGCIAGNELGMNWVSDDCYVSAVGMTSIPVHEGERSAEDKIVESHAAVKEALDEFTRSVFEPKLNIEAYNKLVKRVLSFKYLLTFRRSYLRFLISETLVTDPVFDEKAHKDFCDFAETPKDESPFSGGSPRHLYGLAKFFVRFNGSYDGKAVNEDLKKIASTETGKKVMSYAKTQLNWRDSRSVLAEGKSGRLDASYFAQLLKVDRAQKVFREAEKHLMTDGATCEATLIPFMREVQAKLKSMANAALDAEVIRVKKSRQQVIDGLIKL